MQSSSNVNPNEPRLRNPGEYRGTLHGPKVRNHLIISYIRKENIGLTYSLTPAHLFVNLLALMSITETID